MLSCKLVHRKVLHAFHVSRVTKFLDLLSCYRVFHCVDQLLNFIFINRSLKLSAKASVSIVITVSSIVLTCTFVSLVTNVYISATVYFLARVYRNFWTFFSASFYASTSCLILNFDTFLASLPNSTSDLTWVSVSWRVSNRVYIDTLTSTSTSVSPSVSMSISPSLPASVSTNALHPRWPVCLQVSRPSLLLAC